MAATTATSSCLTTAFFHLYAPTPPPSHKFSLLSKRPTSRRSNLSSSNGLHNISSNSPLISNIILQSVPSTETPIVEEGEEQVIETLTSEANLSPDSGSVPPLTGCKACGREEIENGCNGEGRIQGGIATVPGFGWWPIKAYRPCPAFVASGGRYRRSGQSMDEVVSGGASRNISSGTTSDGAQQSSKKVKGLKKSKR